MANISIKRVFFSKNCLGIDVVITPRQEQSKNRGEIMNYENEITVEVDTSLEELISILWNQRI